MSHEIKKTRVIRLDLERINMIGNSEFMFEARKNIKLGREKKEDVLIKVNLE